MERDSRPFAFEDGPTEFVEFTLKGDFESGAFKANVESANPGEQRRGFETRLSIGVLASNALRSVGNVLFTYLNRHLAAVE
jgi:hypothetical protein